jgi:hypothetical protein
MVVSCRWVAVAVLMSVLGACSSSDSGDDDDDNEGTAGSAGDNGGGAGTAAAVGTELNADMLFSPMYSAFDGEHPFKVPAIVNGYTGVEWSAEDPTLVDLAPMGDNGVMITTRKAGTTRIIARAGALSGSAEIHITEANPADWVLGEQRYNNMVPLPAFDPMAAMGMINIPEDLSCKNCHGGGAQALSVEHTPQQTGGYSDAELIAIFTMGQKPPTAGWRSGIPMFIYTMLHTWAATPEEQKGVVTYLRSLEPMSQGDIDFGGFFNRDAGM